MIKVKSAVMLGAIVGSALSNLCYHNYSTPKNYPFILQTISGAFVGSTINIELVSQLSSYSIAVVIVIVETLAIILLNTFLLRRLFKMSPLTSLIAASPGALSDMTLLSEELGGDMPTVAALQIARMFSIVLIIPYLTDFI
jgi:membrane AbrB-like protein